MPPIRKQDGDQLNVRISTACWGLVDRLENQTGLGRADLLEFALSDLERRLSIALLSRQSEDALRLLMAGVSRPHVEDLLT